MLLPSLKVVTLKLSFGMGVQKKAEVSSWTIIMILYIIND